MRQQRLHVRAHQGRDVRALFLDVAAMRAACKTARRSFGRQEPPKAKPGRRYASDTLSLRSMRKIRDTSCGSAPSAAHASATSLAKQTFSAWKAFAAYLTISAVRIVV